MKKVAGGSLFLILFIGFSAFTWTHNSSPVVTPENTTAIKWMSWTEATEANKTNKKKFFVDVYTEWCGWCKVMDKKTFSDPRVQEILKESFHLIKFDAESKDSIQWSYLQICSPK